MPLRLLVVEDSKTMQRVLQIALSQHDASLAMASSPAEALAAVSQQVFDLLVIDVDLAGQDAYALCRELREACAGDVPAVLITSAQHPFDPGRATHVGVTGHIDKPFATQALVAVVMAAAGHEGPAATSEATHDAPPVPAGQHMAAIDAALAALSAEQDAARTADAACVPSAGARPPAFIRLEDDGAAAPSRVRPKPFFEEETTSSRAFGAAAGPVTVVRRPSDALREQSRAEAHLPSIDALPAMPRFDAPLASPAKPTADERPATPSSPGPLRDEAAAAADSHSPVAAAHEVAPGPLPGAAGPSMAQELVELLQRGPQSASTPALNAALTAALEQQLSQILWQILPGIVTEEVRRVLAHAPPHVPAGGRHGEARAP